MSEAASTQPSATPAPSERTQVRRHPERGSYDRAAIDSILDEGFIAHVGLVADGAPVVIPMLYARDGDVLYLHGAPASRLLRSGRAGDELCVTVTLVDGLVLARSAFHHSLNYRSVVVVGAPREVEDLDERHRALDVLVEHVVPGRLDAVRGSSDKEVRITSVLALPIDEASAKARSGGPVDEPEDYALDHWAGVLPLHVGTGEPVPDEGVTAPVPDHVAGWTR